MSPKDTIFSVKHTLNCGGTVVDLSKPGVMGILNITPDSFYDGGKHLSETSLIGQVHKMVEEGADIIDVGGYSSRPGAAHVASEEEKERIKWALQLIRRNFPSVLISIDTFRSEIAEFAVNEYGACMINDIYAGIIDNEMMPTAARLKVAYLIMHMKGTPENMQHNPHYGDVTKELTGFFCERIARAKESGINDILIDPGFGFGKTVEHNYTLLRELKLFQALECPIVVGISRKSMVYRPLGLSPDEALTGTTALHVLALMNGAKLLRVHDVKEAVHTVKLVDLYCTAGKNSFLL